MNIKIKNNKNGKVETELVKRVAKYYLNELIGETVKDLGTLEITFKKLIFSRGGYARPRDIFHNYEIVINSAKSVKEILSTLAHECTHIKQYYLKELTFKTNHINGRRQNVSIWKGRSYIRKAYKKQPWEIDARKYQKILASNILKKIDAPAKVITKPEPVEVAPVLSNTREIVISILNGGSIPNGELVPRVLDGNKDKQKTLKILREVFIFKSDGFIREVIKDSVVWVELVQ